MIPLAGLGVLVNFIPLAGVPLFPLGPLFLNEHGYPTKIRKPPPLGDANLVPYAGMDPCAILDPGLPSICMFKFYKYFMKLKKKRSQFWSMYSEKAIQPQKNPLWIGHTVGPRLTMVLFPDKNSEGPSLVCVLANQPHHPQPTRPTPIRILRSVFIIYTMLCSTSNYYHPDEDTSIFKGTLCKALKMPPSQHRSHPTTPYILFTIAHNFT